MQKRIITTIGLLLISIFISLTSVKAATKMVFDETSNGNIKTSIHFEDGFVGGIDITLKYSGNVKYKQINLDSGLTKKEYTQNVTHDEKNKTINIKVTTGGVSNKNNLLNINKELVILQKK